MLVGSFPDLSNYAHARAHARMMHNYARIIFAVEVRSSKTANIVRREKLALYGIPE